MTMIPVSSSNLSAVGYEDTTLYVRFHSGSTYAYFNVPENVYNGLLAAPSKGKYLASVIKGSYTYQKL